MKKIVWCRLSVESEYILAALAVCSSDCKLSCPGDIKDCAPLLFQMSQLKFLSFNFSQPVTVLFCNLNIPKNPRYKN